MGYKEDFIDFMVSAGVLKFGDFTTKSGRKTPYFINTGSYKTGEQIAKLGEYYGACIMNEVKEESNILYGPAYKGIPLAITTAIALQNQYHKNVQYCFNRKEAKDHGEGGNLIGYIPQNGDALTIIEDVVTAGTAVRESIALLSSMGDIKIASLVVSVDRMEKGTGEKTAFQELKEDYGINTYAIVTIKDIIAHLHNRECNGVVYIDDVRKAQMEDYMKTYCVK